MSKVITNLYGGEAKVIFDPDATGKRYTVTDPVMGFVDKKLRGVTTVIGEIIDKPGLRMWPMDMAMGALFGHAKTPDNKGILRLGASLPKDPADMQLILDEARNAHKGRADRGKDIGHMVHGYVELFLKRKVTELTAERVHEDYPDAPDEFVKSAMKAFEAFKGVWASLGATVIGIEQPVYSRKYQFAGTYDLTAKIGKKIYMLDLKTTNRSEFAPLGIYAENFMQLGGYSQAVFEGQGMVFDDCGIINVGKDGKVNIALASDLNMTVQECMNSFKAAVAIHDWLSKSNKLLRDRNFISSLAPSVEKVVPEETKVKKEKK